MLSLLLVMICAMRLLALFSIAMGAVDAYFEFGFHIWDYAAPALIVTEAGGAVMDTTGAEVDLLARRMVAASSQELATQILPLITHMKMDRD